MFNMGKWKEVDGRTFSMIFHYYDHEYDSSDGLISYYKNSDGNIGKIQEIDQETKYFIYKGVIV